MQLEKKLAKFWLNPVELAKTKGFSTKELNEIRKIIEKKKERFIEAWNEYFSN